MFLKLSLDKNLRKTIWPKYGSPVVVLARKSRDTPSPYNYSTEKFKRYVIKQKSFMHF